MKSVCEFTYKDLKTAIDPNFLRARDRIRQLRTRGTRYAGLRGMSLYFRTPSSEYDKNHIIWTQEIKLLDLPEALLMDDLTLREKVNLSMNGDVAVRCNCLVGDTPIPLLDGRTLTMEQLEKEFGTEKRFWVYSVNEKGDFVPAKARCLGKTGDVRKLVRVTLDNNESFTCTPDHPVMRRDGSWVLAGNLVGGESLMSIYRRTGTADAREAKKQMVMNHKVASVVHLELDDSVPVYDLEVDVTHNFLIGPGIIVHNCPAMLYWGYAYLVSQLDAGAPGKLYSVPPNDVEMPENRFPGIRNPNLRGSVCKHLGLVFEVFGAHWNSLERDLKSQGYE